MLTRQDIENAIDKNPRLSKKKEKVLEEIMYYYTSPVPVREILERVGMTRMGFYARLKKLGLPLRETLFMEYIEKSGLLKK